MGNMYYPYPKSYFKLAKPGLIIPVYREILADLETPVSAFKKLSQESKYSFLLESVEGGERLGRYSFIGIEPRLIFQSKGNDYQIISSKFKEEGKSKDPIDKLKSITKPFKSLTIKGLPRFFGGAVGYISYDMVRFWEEIPKLGKDDLQLPDSFFLLADKVVIFDHVQHKMKFVCNTFIEDVDKVSLKDVYKHAVQNIEKMIQRLESSSFSFDPPQKLKHQENWQSNFTKENFMKAVDKCKEYIKAGDTLQIVLSQRWKKKTSADPLNIYRTLRSLNPSPYMYYLKFDKFNIVGSSPEILVRKEGKKIVLRPIAGTRPRGKDESEDEKLQEELLKDAKEKAEHIMLVDLGRNDVGRVSSMGSVSVTELMTIEKYSHVMHIVSNVEGQLKKGEDEYQVLKASFPAGTVTGAPKIRAMEIIEELEPTQRGPYAGCVGYFSFSGNLDSCITIRTVLIKDDVAYVQAGAGIVADSQREREYQETRNKAQALMDAVDMTERGLL